MRLLVASALPISAPGPLTTLIAPGGHDPLDQLHQLEDRPRRRAGRLEHHRVPGGERRRQLPRRHQQREVERDDLADHSERLLEVVGDRVLVQLGDRPLLAPDHRGEVAEVIRRQRDVGGERLAHRLAVLPALGDGEQLEVVLDRVRHLVQHARALGRRGLAPGVLGRVGRVERELDVRRGRARHRREPLAGGGRHVLAVLAVQRRDPLAADEVLVAFLQLDGTVGLTRSSEGRRLLDRCHDVPPIVLSAVYSAAFSRSPLRCGAASGVVLIPVWESHIRSGGPGAGHACGGAAWCLQLRQREAVRMMRRSRRPIARASERPPCGRKKSATPIWASAR